MDWGTTGLPSQIRSACPRSSRRLSEIASTRKAICRADLGPRRGALVAMESGTTVTDIFGQPLDFGHGRGLEANTGVIAAAPEIHSALLEAVGSAT